MLLPIERGRCKQAAPFAASKRKAGTKAKGTTTTNCHYALYASAFKATPRKSYSAFGASWGYNPSIIWSKTGTSPNTFSTGMPQLPKPLANCCGMSRASLSISLPFLVNDTMRCRPSLFPRLRTSKPILSMRCINGVTVLVSNIRRCAMSFTN